jgi:hypothetical protein
MSRKSSWVLGALAVGLATMSGCAEERDPINQVQANALHKSFFVGADIASGADDPEFYSAVTVVDVPFGADQAGVFTGLVGGLKRVKWEITENVLNARMSYELIEGVDGHGASRIDSDGLVIAAWPITSHFDIRHAYNPSTGEELNVVVENTTDRPWNEREYFRVDWSVNLVTSSRLWDPLGGAGYDSEPLQYYVNDPTHPDRPVFDVEDGYFDITNKMHLKPKTIDLGAGPAPACFYRGSIVLGATYPWGNCDNSEISARYSFRRVAQEGEKGFTDYQPVEWDGSRMRSFGAFVQQRLGWDRNYGIVDSEWHYFANRYNIWSKSHSEKECATPDTTPYGCNASRDGDLNCNNKIEAEQGEIPDGTHDECEDGENFGSKCDKLVGKCTIPFSKRAPKPVAWHYTVNAEDTVMWESTEEATWQWDAALRMAVQTARYTECVRTGTKSLTGSTWDRFKNEGADLATARGTCGALFPVDQSYDESEQDAVREVNICRKNGGGKECVDNVPTQNEHYLEGLRSVDSTALSYSVAAMDPMVVLCHSPVKKGDHEACGGEGTVARPGDIRYHQVNVWPTRQTLSPWGYGPSLADPLTGEIISAGINVYNAVTDNAAQTFLDQIRWINGEISSKDITDGEHTFEWVQASAYEQMHMGPLMSQDEINDRISGISGIRPDQLNRSSSSQIPDQKLAIHELQEIEKTAVPPGVIPEDRAIFEERIAKAKETGVEAELVNPMWLQMAGVDPDLEWDEQLELASPLRGMDARKTLEAYEFGQRLLAQQGQCILAAPEPTSIPAVAKIMKVKFPYVADAPGEEQHKRLEQMWNYLRYKLNFNVILHEMGHTVSLRHNFVSSWDKFNFKTQYWQLRTDNGRVTTQCQGPQTDGATCVGPRYFDPLTQDEVDNAIWTWQQTSVMDYAGDITQDMLGLGVYDLAATRMFYADTVDVRADVVVDGSGGIGDGIEAIVDNPGYLVDQAATFGVHYTEYNELFKLVQPDRCYAANLTQPAWWDVSKMGVWDPVFDGRTVHNERCTRPPVDYVQWEDLQPDQITVAFEDPEFFTPRRPKDIYERPRVPYGFLSDEYADGWSPSAFRHDNGADAYEAAIFHSNLYENRHIFDNYRNGRVNFTVYGAYQRALARYHAKIENLTQGIAYIAGYYLRELALNENAPYDELLAAYMSPNSWLYNQSIAAGIGFDHFVRVMTRPHTGPHYCQTAGSGCNENGDRVLHPLEDVVADGTPAGTGLAGYLPNGIFVAGDALSYAARPIDNNFQYSHGYWTFNYLNQSGSYYEKTYAAQAMLNATYGAINFFRLDGVDARFRHVNFGDLFPDGMRRFLGVALMEDQSLLGPRISANGSGQPNFELSPYVDADDEQAEMYEYPVDPMAWVSYIPASGPMACAPVDDVMACIDTMGTPIRNGAPVENTAWFVDPQLGYEVQKFIVFWYYVYQPGKQTYDWVELMRIYKLGSDLDPDYLPEDIVEWRDPESGHRYLAKRYGDETIFGKTYDKGIAAKMIQWANHLTEQAYQLDAVTPFDPVTGRANVLFDVDGKPMYKVGTTCDDNKACFQLRRYRGLLDYTRDTAAHLGFPEAGLQIFGPDN